MLNFWVRPFGFLFSRMALMVFYKNNGALPDTQHRGKCRNQMKHALESLIA